MYYISLKYIKDTFPAFYDLVNVTVVNAISMLKTLFLHFMIILYTVVNAIMTILYVTERL